VNKGHDTRAIQDWLGHRSIQHTVRYTELSLTQFKTFGADRLNLNDASFDVHLIAVRCRYRQVS